MSFHDEHEGDKPEWGDAPAAHAPRHWELQPAGHYPRRQPANDSPATTAHTDRGRAQDVELMHKPNGDPNHYNASPRVLKQKREVFDTTKQAGTAAGAAKPPMQASEPVEAGPISSLRAQMSPDDSARFFWGKVRRTPLSCKVMRRCKRRAALLSLNTRGALCVRAACGPRDTAVTLGLACARCPSHVPPLTPLPTRRRRGRSQSPARHSAR